MNKFLTQGDQKLAEFLSREINLEKEDYNYNYNNVLPRVKGFQSEITGSEVSLTKDYPACRKREEADQVGENKLETRSRAYNLSPQISSPS